MAGNRDKSSSSKESSRLEANDWVNAALVELTDRGIDGVSIGAIARKLNVTTGSFYWHFKDRDALLLEMLATWRRKATLVVIERLEKRGTSPMQRLESLLRFPFASLRAPEGADVELAVRLWGRNDVRAREVLNEIDRLRMRFIVSIFADLGCDAADSNARAALLYGFMRVGSSLPQESGHDAMVDEIRRVLVPESAMMISPAARES